MKATGARDGHGRSGPRARPAAAGTFSSSAWATTRRSATTLVPAAATSSPVDACSCRRRWFLLRSDRTSIDLVFTNRVLASSSSCSACRWWAGRTDGCGGAGVSGADGRAGGADGRTRGGADGRGGWGYDPRYPGQTTWGASPQVLWGTALLGPSRKTSKIYPEDTTRCVRIRMIP